MPFGGGPQGAPAPEAPKKAKRVPFFGPVNAQPVTDVQIVGNEGVPTPKILSMLKTRAGRDFDEELLRRDVRTLISSGLFSDVKPFVKQQEGGQAITFQVTESPCMKYVRFEGNQKVKDKHLQEAIGFRAGDPLHRFTVEEGRRRIANVYEQKGFTGTKITITEGVQPNDPGVVYTIEEGKVIRVYKTRFEGNHIVSGAHLKTQIESKPGVLWLLGGKANLDQIDQDIDRLTAYYRALGYFRAKIEKRLEFNKDGDWLTITFAIDEGPRYQVRTVRFLGNKTFSTEQLLALTQTRESQYFDMAIFQRDQNLIRDEYGSLGYIFAEVTPELRFHEEAGWLDLVYKIDEGQQHRVGRIIVNIEGNHAQTKRTVVLNRLSIRPGDIVDIREIRRSERLLKNSQLFLNEPAQGIAPQIVVKPRLDEDSRFADEPGARSGTTYRGQDAPLRRQTYRPVIDLHIVGAELQNNAQPDAVRREVREGASE